MKKYRGTRMYSKKEWKIKTIFKIILDIIISPLLLILWLFMIIGDFSEYILDKIDNLFDFITRKLVDLYSYIYRINKRK